MHFNSRQDLHAKFPRALIWQGPDSIEFMVDTKRLTSPYTLGILGKRFMVPILDGGDRNRPNYVSLPTAAWSLLVRTPDWQLENCAITVERKGSGVNSRYSVRMTPVSTSTAAVAAGVETCRCDTRDLLSTGHRVGCSRK